MRAMIDFVLNEGDKKLLIILLFFMVLMFILIGLLGWLVRWITLRFQGRMDYEIHDAVIYRVISSPEQLRRYGREKNHRLWVKANIGPFLILLFSFIVWLAYSATSHVWIRDYGAEFSTLLYNFDWSNENCHAVVWGINVLSRWPDTLSTPHWVWEYWGSYLLIPAWTSCLLWHAVNAHAYIAREFLLRKRCQTVFEKSLEDFNYFDDQKAQSAPIPPPGTPPGGNPSK